MKPLSAFVDASEDFRKDYRDKLIQLNYELAAKKLKDPGMMGCEENILAAFDLIFKVSSHLKREETLRKYAETCSDYEHSLVLEIVDRIGTLRPSCVDEVKIRCFALLDLYMKQLYQKE